MPAFPLHRHFHYIRASLTLHEPQARGYVCIDEATMVFTS